MTSTEIYNTYLGVSRGSQNKPWRARKNFDGFDTTPDGFICKRLEMFFNKFPQIRPYEFFKAPYILYPGDKEYFPLSFYTSQKAIAAYSNVEKQKKEELPDTSSQLEDIRKSLKFIALTCINEGITLNQYCQKSGGYTYQSIVDYSNKSVNIYVLIRLPFFEEQLKSLSPQDRVLYLKDSVDSILKYRMRLNSSIQAKRIIDEGFQLINKINNNKTTSN